MKPSRRVIILGCGTSVGVPVLGCQCAVCLSTHPRNQRTRSSVLFELPQGNLLIDSTPEMRIQLLREKVGLVHAVAYTHYHVDHLFGLDDLRVFPSRLGGPMPIYCTDEVERVIRHTFSYAFAERSLSAGFVPNLVFQRITDSPFEVLGETVTPIPLRHAHFDVFGFRIGNLAYCTDVNLIPETSWPLLEGVETLILDALRPGRSHPSHFSVEDALQVVERVNPRQTFFTHMAHELDYANPPIGLPDGVALAYDGLTIEF